MTCDAITKDVTFMSPESKRREEEVYRAKTLPAETMSENGPNWQELQIYRFKKLSKFITG